MTQFGRFDVYNDNIEISDPGAGNDSTQGYEVGSRWFNSVSFGAWICLDATAGAAQWFPMTSEQAIGTIIGANMNVTTDQPFVFPFAAGRKFSIDAIVASNPSVSLTTAVGGIYSAASKGGTAVVAAAQAYSALTAVGTKLNLTIAAAGAALVCNSPLYLSLTTPQGAAATADFYFFGKFIRA